MHLPDLSRVEADPVVGVPWTAVGWLERGHPYSQGEVAADFFEKLDALARDPWNGSFSAGVHPCSLCRFKQGPRGHRQIYLPSLDALFVCPELIVHYVVAHEYCPPIEFQRAVVACPPMRSMAYFRELRRLGVSVTKKEPPTP